MSNPVPAASTDAELSAWLRSHASTLDTVEVDDPLDDLEPLAEIVGDARVVGIGEGAHFVREFAAARQRLLRFLVERCGFTVFAFEFGFSEAYVLDRWIQGEGAEQDLADVAGAALDWGTTDLIRWLRRYNQLDGPRVRFVGLDVSHADVTLRAALDPVEPELAEVDPDALPMLREVLSISDHFIGGSMAAAAPAWAELGEQRQDRLTALLTRLLFRMRALEPWYVDRIGQHRYAVARRRLEAASHTDHMFGALHNVFSGSESTVADTSVREVFLAESVRWHLAGSPSGSRMVLAAHNNHIQKTPVQFGDSVTTLPMGHHLERMLGTDYRTVGVTHTDDHVPEMHPDQSTEVGFRLVDTAMDAPGAGSIEAALTDAGLADRITLTPLRAAPRDTDGQPWPRAIRTQSAEMSTMVSSAFDTVLAVPTISRDESVPF